MSTLSSKDRSPKNPRRRATAEIGDRAVRFPVKLPVRYRVGEEFGWGELVNISSSGALFTTESPLPLKKRVELWINWPALLMDSVPLKLVVYGVIVRLEPGRAAVKIGKHEFRTSSSSFLREASAPDTRSSQGTMPEHSTRGLSLQVQVANHAM